MLRAPDCESRMNLTNRGTAAEQAIKNSVAMPLWLVAGGVVLITFNLRPPITAVSPMLDQVQRQEGFNSTIASLLVAVPLMCFVVFSPGTPHIGRRLGLERCVALSMVVLLIGFLLRLIPTVWALFLGTAVIGLAITVGNVLLPATIKRDYPARTGLLTGLYTMSLYVGAAAAAGFTLPLQEATGLGWRGTIGLWSGLSLVGFLAWLPQLRPRQEPVADSVARHSRGTLWKQPLAWAVTVSFTVPTLVFYALSAWLPTILIDSGMSPARAGSMLSIVNLAAIPFALFAPIAASRTRQQVWCITLAGVFLAIGLLGVLHSATDNTALWMIFFGVGLGSGTGLAYTIPLLRTRDSRKAAELSAMCQTVGFMFSALAPVLAGALHDLTDSWTASLIALLFLVAIQIVAGFRAGRARYVA
jgi:CP family cyanate transporter-like MFS transporter